jgi:hypothetical protein
VELIFDPTKEGRSLLREAYSQDAFTLLSFPEIFGLSLSTNNKTDKDFPNFRTPVINARKALIIGPTSVSVTECSDPDNYTRNRIKIEGTDCDHLAYLLAGGMNMQQYDFETKLPSFAPECFRGIRNNALFRRSTGLCYGVTQIDQESGCNLKRISDYLEKSRSITTEDDLLLVFIQGPSIQWRNQRFNPEPIRDYARFIEQINLYPGWKVVIDLSQHSGELLSEFFQFYNPLSEDSKTLVVTSSFGTTLDCNLPFYTDRLADHIIDKFSFASELNSISFDRFVRELSGENGDEILAPQIIGNFSLKL